MRGHQALIALRRRGLRPWAAFVSDGADRLGAWRDWQDDLSAAHFEVQADDNPLTLDLRCLTGMLVFIDSEDRRRLLALHRACIDAGAKRVMSALFAPDVRSGIVKAVEHFDSALQHEEASA